jgi:hypothetical protein
MKPSIHTLKIPPCRIGWTLLLAAAMFTNSPRIEAVGYWSKMPASAPDSVAMMIQLSDGTVMAANNPNDAFNGVGNKWYRLLPNIYGSYLYGSWGPRSPMNYHRLFFSSEVLTDGRLFVAGGEYGDGATASAEIYDPYADAWTIVNPPLSLMDSDVNSPTTGRAQGILDAESKVLPNGNVLMAPVSPSTNNGTLIYNPSANSWSAGPASLQWQAEVSWVKLPDGSILTIDPLSPTTGLYGTNSERYIPSLGKWVPDSNLPVNLWANLSPAAVGEIGPAFLLPDGRAFFLGGSGHTAYYTPTGNTSSGSWAQGPDIPAGLVAADAPGCMMVNGKILVAVSPPPSVSGNSVNFPSPTIFFEFDYTVGPNGHFFQTGSPTGGFADDIPSQNCNMLALPDGSVLYCHYEQGNVFYSSFGNQLYVYTPDGTPLASGKPTINNITLNSDGSFHLTGTLLNGISEGAAFGDNAQMNGNYPLVRVTDGSNNRTYLRTYNWSSTGVQTGGTLASTEFSARFIGPGFYSLEAVANGIASDPVSFYGPVWVDFNYLGVILGTYDYPYKTLAAGVNAVAPGGTIVIKPGTSTESMYIAKPMSIKAIGSGATIGL